MIWKMAASRKAAVVGKDVKDGLEVVERVMKKYRAVAVPGLPRFTGGAVGFIGYEFIHDVEPVVPRPPQDELKTPVMYFLVADQILIFDRVAQTITILVNAILDDAESPAEAYENATSEIDRIVSLLEQPSEHTAVAVTNEIPPSNLPPTRSKEKFFANVEASKKYIHRRRHHPGGRLAAVFRAGHGVAAGYLSRGAQHQSVALYVFAGAGRIFARRRVAGNCTSAARKAKLKFARLPARVVAAKMRRKTLALEKELLADPKERAEHVMLVDLARNDIGRVCDFGQRAGEGIDDYRALQPRHAHRFAGGRKISARKNRITI